MGLYERDQLYQDDEHHRTPYLFSHSPRAQGLPEAFYNIKFTPRLIMSTEYDSAINTMKTSTPMHRLQYP